jgi:ribosomal protein L16 Arg81 hydroxylase
MMNTYHDAVQSPLTPLLAPSGPLLNAYHGADPLLLRQAASVESLPGIDRIYQLIDASLLRWPYFTVFKEGIRTDKQAIVEVRHISGQPVGGFLNANGVRQALADGATLRLSAVGDWDRAIRDQARELGRTFPANIKTFLFFTPAGQRGMLPHRDGSRVIVIQIAGVKQWTLFDAPESRNSSNGIDIDPATATASHFLRPGDVLYLPHAYPHAATALDSLSLHVTFTITEPTPTQLTEAVFKEWLEDEANTGLLAKSASVALPDRVAAVLASFAEQLASIDPQKLVARAVGDFETR